MSIGMMDELDIDQSQTDKMITCGDDIQGPMVPMGYWTDTRVQTLCMESSTEKKLSQLSKSDSRVQVESKNLKQNLPSS
jgi:hypothetical protein